MSPCALIDSHAHVDYDKFDDDREEVLKRARNEGLQKIINIVLGPEPAAFERSFDLLSKEPDIFFGVGIHPHDVVRMNDESIAVLKDFSKRPRVVVLGEIGLDFYYERSPRYMQCDRFGELLDLALDLKLPVSIHSRDAFDDTYRLLSERDIFRKVGGVLHCFTGTALEAEKFLDLGAFISFSGIVTFKKATNVQDAAKVVPLDRLLIETDAPFLAPEPFRGQRNEPSYVSRTAMTLAALKGVTVDEIARHTTHNAESLFKI